MAARVGVEREVPGGRQRRLERHHRVSGARGRADARLRRRLHRHRPHRQQRQLRLRPSREADRLRLPRRPRDDGARQGDRRRLLRQGARVCVLGRLLVGGQTGSQGSAALSRRLRRHRQRRAGECLDAPGGELRLDRAGDAGEFGELRVTREVRAPAPGGARRLRRARRREGRHHRRIRRGVTSIRRCCSAARATRGPAA